MPIRESDCQVNTKWKGCCCNCKNQVAIHGHPWNEGDMKASIQTVVGYGCKGTVDGNDNKIIFMNRKHGFCEMHQTVEEGIVVNDLYSQMRLYANWHSD